MTAKTTLVLGGTGKTGRRIAEQLSALGARDAVPALVAALDDPDDVVRGAAADALGAIGDPTAVPGLLASFHRASRDVRYAVAGALTAFPTAEVAAAMVAATRHPDPGIRADAAHVLGPDVRMTTDLYLVSEMARQVIRGLTG